jgi:hypothetical protein
MIRTKLLNGIIGQRKVRQVDGPSSSQPVKRPERTMAGGRRVKTQLMQVWNTAREGEDYGTGCPWPHDAGLEAYM